MIRDNKCYVEITNKNRKYYVGRGYTCVAGDMLEIKIDTMSKMSHNKIIAICEVCLSEKEISYSKYNLNKDRHGYYSCKKCSTKKRKDSCFEKYGVENIAQLSGIREKNRIWMLSEEFKVKSKESIMSIYGTSSFSKTDEFKQMSSDIHTERIAKLKIEGKYVCPLSRPDNRIKRETAMFEKYGATYSYNIPIIKEKINLKKVENQKKKFKDDIFSKNCDIEYKLAEYEIYRNKVRYLTEQIRLSLFNSWDGYDYYDSEYIKDNLKLNSNDKRYPTVDHKISCFYGFINDIPVTVISDISNLCITKRYLNGKKGILNEDSFII